MTIARILLGALALVAVGCGGDDDDDDDSGGLSCSSAACGGDITGVWNINESCPGVEGAAPEECPNAVIDITSGPDISGTATFVADGTYSMDVHVTAQVEVTVPPECTLNGTIRCDSLPAMFEEDAPGATCADGAVENSCDCSLPVETDADENGTWTVNGSTLTTVADGETNESQFCVQGDDLLVIMSTDLAEVSILGSR
ncbi:MAG: hypothetical protein HYY06_12210 [Deltaproteobacteria bacterium]|nr:hypothetical protein [Deltaproteobacteria bacterium]